MIEIASDDAFSARIGMRYILLTHSSDEYRELADLTEPSKAAYCKRWGMEYIRVRMPAGNCWDRPVLWREQLENCDRILFMGADAVVTNREIPPEMSTAELVIAADGNGINDDVFFMRRTDRTMEFLLDLIQYPDKSGSEQDAMSLLLAGMPSIAEFEQRLKVRFERGGVPATPYLLEMLNAFFKHRLEVRVVGQRELNGYLQSYYGRSASEPYGWQPGDFIAHFPGLGMEDRIRGVREVLAGASF
jgi:hypothetical protein